jgi:NADH-quinone oxidoreductase subunit L
MGALGEHPGLLFVAATLLPLASFVLLLLAGAVRWAARPHRDTPLGGAIYSALGGDVPARWPAYVATGAIAGAFVLSVVGFVYFLQHHPIHWVGEHQAESHSAGEGHEHSPAAHGWEGSINWAFRWELGPNGDFEPATGPASVLTLGYRIDSLTIAMFLMVTFVATLIHLFSMGYMADELQPIVADHQVHSADGHLHRRGRFGRFFLYLSLFCFSMLNLVLADNLFQVFLSWELVGVCSYLLIGFYYERRSASNAANKAFITNRVGDAGFIIGLLILWTYAGTFNFQELFGQHGKIAELLESGSLPMWLLTAAGLGIFLGCVGKSAQFPLHVWLPDAMEGPTPVSALIHAATMVAAGVYLVGRTYPLFTPEARLVIAYTGGITLFVAATIAIVMTDIKKVLAYSTVSQLGYMMLALGIGGWVAGLFHLLTHAFFKALLFLGSGSVIYGCHHEQDMLKMGGLKAKMPITAYTMLTGVLAIAGIPLFSGWYSKDAILAQAMAFGLAHAEHFLLFLLPLVTAGITTFYMFRMWFLTFMGEPRDAHVHEHARESPWLMTVPLILLAVCSIFVAWGMPPWQAHESFIGRHGGLLQSAEPPAVLAQVKSADVLLARSAEEYHDIAGLIALGIVGLGILFAALIYLYRVLDPAESKEQFPAVYRFLWNKWYFDELYSAILVRPALVVAGWFSAIDLRGIDGVLHGASWLTVLTSWASGKFDLGVVDGLVNLCGNVVHGVGDKLRDVQTGFIRSYVLFLVLAAVGLFLLLSWFVTLAVAR